MIGQIIKVELRHKKELSKREYVEIVNFFSDPDNDMMATVTTENESIQIIYATDVKIVTLANLNKKEI